MESNSSVNQMEVASSSVTETPAPVYSVELVSDVIEPSAVAVPTSTPEVVTSEGVPMKEPEVKGTEETTEKQTEEVGL